VATDEVADLFSKILGVIAGALEGLGHEDDLQAGLAGNCSRDSRVWRRKNKIAEAIDLGVGSKNVDGLAKRRGRRSLSRASVSIFSRNGKPCE